MDLAIIIAGLLIVVLSMALIINPPEALVKRAYLGKQRRAKQNGKDTLTEPPPSRENDR